MFSSSSTAKGLVSLSTISIVFIFFFFFTSVVIQAMEGDIREIDNSEFEPPLIGGTREINDFENDIDTDHIDLARFAVDDYNKKHNGALEFVKLVKAKYHVVAGIMYIYTLEAKEGDEKKLYETKIWVRLWENFKEVQEFKPVQHPHTTSSTN